MAYVNKNLWPETNAVLVSAACAPDGTRIATYLAQPEWPPHIEVADELMDEPDARWLRGSAQDIWFTLTNGYAHYRLVERDDATLTTLCALIEGDVF